MSMLKRGEISVFNIVCITAVVLIHALSGLENRLADMPKTVYLILFNISGFVFEAFIFLSGLRLFLNRYDTMTMDTFYVNRLVLVLLPYFVFTLIYYACFCLVGERSADLWDFFVFFIKGEQAPDMYFILTLFQFYLLMPIVSRLLKKINHKAVLIISFIISVIAAWFSGIYPNLNRFFPQYICFFLGGALAAIYYKEFKTFMRERKLIIFVIFILSAVLYEAAGFFLSAAFAAACRELYAVGAILLLFMISTIISDKYYIRNFILIQVDKCAYFIFLLNGLVLFLTDIVLKSADSITDLAAIYGIRVASALVVTVLVSITWRYIRNILFLKSYR